MLNLVSLSTQSLASCVNYFVWNCFTCFSNTKIGSVTSFSIVFNFPGPVRRSLAADDLIILPQKRFFVKLYFFEAFERSELGCFKVSRRWPELFSVYWFFSKASCWGFRSHSLSQRLALKYNTTPPAFCQHFSASFFLFFQILFSPWSIRPVFQPFRS